MRCFLTFEATTGTVELVLSSILNGNGTGHILLNVNYGDGVKSLVRCRQQLNVNTQL